MLRPRLLRAYTRAAIRCSSTKASPTNRMSADWLVGLGKAENKDEEAEKWLDAIAELRSRWKPSGQAFDVNRAFAPEGMEEDFDFWAAADAEIVQQRRANRIDASPEQVAEAAALKDKPIPPKRDDWMNMLTNHVMRHGDKAKAYKTVNRALYLVFLKLRKDPVAELLSALDKMAPLAQVHRISDGGARVELFPVPYSEMRRIGLAWKWVIESSQKRQSRDFAVRLSEEIIAAIQGRSSGFEKGMAIHKTAVANRSIAEEVQQGRWKR